MDNKTVKDRLIAYLKYKGVNKSEFGRSIGVSSAFISSMRKSLQPDKAEKIALEYPDLDMGWLLTGEGSMLRERQSGEQSNNSSASGNGVAVSGNNNQVNGAVSSAEAALLKEKVALLECLVEEKERLLAEKERTIQILLKK